MITNSNWSLITLTCVIYIYFSVPTFSISFSERENVNVILAARRLTGELTTGLATTLKFRSGVWPRGVDSSVKRPRERCERKSTENVRRRETIQRFRLVKTSHIRCVISYTAGVTLLQGWLAVPKQHPLREDTKIDERRQWERLPTLPENLLWKITYKCGSLGFIPPHYPHTYG